MLITILAEYRTGSTSLAEWFIGKDKFSVLIEPLNLHGLRDIKNSKEMLSIFKSGDNTINPKLWKYPTENLIVKEIYDKNITHLNELIEISDKIIVLYREDDDSQLKSFINGSISNNWCGKWLYDEKNTNSFVNEIPPNYIENFYFVKNSIKNDFINRNNYFTISYEELYYRNGIARIIEYINLPQITNHNFPFGEKYRVNLKLI
jgi:hypothetical protein